MPELSWLFIVISIIHFLVFYLRNFLLHLFIIIYYFIFLLYLFIIRTVHCRRKDGTGAQLAVQSEAMSENGIKYHKNSFRVHIITVYLRELA